MRLRRLTRQRFAGDAPRVPNDEPTRLLACERVNARPLVAGSALPDTAPNPRPQLALRTHVGGLDAQPAAHRAAPHLHRFRASRGHELVELHRIYAHENTTLPACRDGHVPAHEEREPTEHPLFGYAAFIAQEVADA